MTINVCSFNKSRWHTHRDVLHRFDGLFKGGNQFYISGIVEIGNGSMARCYLLLVLQWSLKPYPETQDKYQRPKHFYLYKKLF